MLMVAWPNRPDGAIIQSRMGGHAVSTGFSVPDYFARNTGRECVLLRQRLEVEQMAYCVAKRAISAGEDFVRRQAIESNKRVSRLPSAVQ
jgi:hypothetical protein